MAAPWEKYAAAAEPDDGPWAKYVEPAKTDEQRDPSLLDKAKGTLEAGVATVGGGIASAVGQVGGFIGAEAARGVQAIQGEGQGSPREQAERVQQVTQQAGAAAVAPFQPTTAEGKRQTAAVGEVAEQAAPLAPMTSELGAISAGARGSASLIKADARSAAQIAAREGAKRLAPAAERIAAKGEASTAAKVAQAAPKNEGIQQARQFGLVLNPSRSGGVGGKTAAGASGAARIDIRASHINAKRVNAKAAEDVGLKPDEPLNEATIERRKQAEYGPYKAVSALPGRVKMDDKFQADMKSALERTEGEAADYPEDFNARVQEQIDKVSVPDASPASMLGRIKSLRARAGKNMKSLDAENFELGIAQKKIATAMEDQIDRSVATTHPELIGDFRKARVALAKIHNVEDALSPAGNVNAAILARQLQRGVPLSGNLKEIAELRLQFPNEMKSVDGLGGDHAFSVLDAMIGVAGAFSHPGGALAIAARPLTRAALTSKAYQSAAIKPRVPQASRVTKLARKVANKGKRPEPGTLADMPDEEQAAALRNVQAR